MSLVSTYVRAKDGLFYRNPEFGGDGWFICFDDDDPVEIVIKWKNEAGYGKKQSKAQAIEILAELGIKHTSLTESGGGMRIFKRSKFEDAYAWFFEIENRIDPKFIKKHDGTIKSINEIGQGVIYDPKE